MSNYLVTTEELTSIANEIRLKTFSESGLEFPNGYINSIRNITGSSTPIQPAFESMPNATTNEGLAKMFAPYPEYDYDYWANFTNSSNDLVINYNITDENQIYLAIFTIRNLDEAPEAPEGWTLLCATDPFTDDSIKQMVVVYTRESTIEDIGAQSITLSQPDGTTYFYGLVTRIDCTSLGRVKVGNIDFIEENGETLASITPQYSNSLIIPSVINTYQSILYDAWTGAKGTYCPKIVSPVFNDGRPAGARLSVLNCGANDYRTDDILLYQLTYLDGRYKPFENQNVGAYCEIEIEPNDWYYVTRVDDNTIAMVNNNQPLMLAGLFGVQETEDEITNE